MLLPLIHNHSFLTSKTLDRIISSSPSPKFPPKSLTCLARAPDADTVPKTAIQRIAEKLRGLGYVEEAPEPKSTSDSSCGAAGEIFIPTPRQLPIRHVGHTIDTSWSSPQAPVPEPGSGVALSRFHELRTEVKRQEEAAAAAERRKNRQEEPPTVAELTIPSEELRRLRTVGIRLRKKLKVGKAGITEGIVNGIHERWRRSEVVKIRCEDLCRINMKRTHGILERKTGGMVVWRSGSIIILYRGANYEYPYFLSVDNASNENENGNISSDSGTDDELDGGGEDHLSGMANVNSSNEPLAPRRLASSSLVSGVGSPNQVRFQLPGEVQLEEEADRLLDGLGPRFRDWWGYNPLPVDADLLPPIIPGYRKPFRLLPYGIKPKLTDDEMTTLRRLGKPLPCHFALGRNKNLQGLAVSIIKLWEKCEIAKVAVKRGVQNTNSLMMAEELKQLTGGTLIFRNAELVVLYRGKDFLPPAVSAAIQERRKHEISTLKLRADENSLVKSRLDFEAMPTKPSRVEVIQEIDDVKRNSGLEQRKLGQTRSRAKSLDAKLRLTLEKKARAEKLLEDLEKAAEYEESEVDKEGITDEERYMLRKVGLRMKPFLLMGRRGVFDGTIENMHLHWKYRELVKVIMKDQSVVDVHRTARTLEAESGGILVAVERVSKGHAVIVYRGKNYRQPTNLRPRTLLNKKQALKRSLEAQRRESLKLHILELTKNINQVKLQLIKEEPDAVGSCSLSIDSSYEGEESKTAANLTESTYPVDNMQIKEELNAVGGCSLLVGPSYHGEEDKATSNMTESTYPVDSGQIEEDLDEAVCCSLSIESTYDGEENKATANMTESTYPDMPQQVGIGLSSTTENISSNELSAPSIDTYENGYGSPFHKEEMGHPTDVEFPSRVLQLSNRDRLLLRKQALKMKKRPVLAVGRNNVVTGVAKAIKTHFRKNPLAIVNIKGRAKGTSVEEVVFELEKATGALLVSREPNKVILHRGWGLEELDESKIQRGAESRMREVVSSQLLAAIRIECGLQVPLEDAQDSRS